MALTLDATVGGASSNTYITLAAAETYFEGKFHKDTWTAETDANKNIALVEATRILDALYVWAKWPTDQDQALQWPRNGILDSNRVSLIPSDELPDELTWATCELAQAILVSDRSADSDVEVQGLTKLKAGSVELNWKESGIVAKVIPDVVLNYIPDWWGYVSDASPLTVPMARA